MKLSLANTPNQKLPFLSGDYTYVLTLRIFEGVLYATVDIDDETIIASRRVTAGEDIFFCDHLQKKYGNLTFYSKYDTAVTDYSTYNEAVYLEFIPPTE